MDATRDLLIAYFGQYVTENKKRLIEKVLAQRTRHVTVILENLFQSQNASAVVRTCECLGLQEVHIIEDEARYGVNRRVLKGANKWIELVRHKQKAVNNTVHCMEQLRARGFQILAADPSPKGISIHDVELDSKAALLVGNELHGISDYARAHADALVRVPMFGFTESFNVSVGAALAITALLNKLRSSPINWQLDQEDMRDIRLRWYRGCVRKSDLLEKEYLRSFQ